MFKHALAAIAVSLFLASAAPAQETAASPDAKIGWLASSEELASKVLSQNQPPQSATQEASTQPPPAKGPPLPFHTVEGVSGACIVPMAYMANAGPPGTIIGKPSAALTYLKANRKNVEAFTMTEVFYRRIEVGYALGRFGMGTLPGDIRRATGVDIDTDEVWLHNFNARVMLIEESSWLPALTAGVGFKYNQDVADINAKLFGGLNKIGYRRSNGTDYTLTATKMLPVIFGRPLIVTAGLRNSQAAQLGYLGFGDSCATTVEASVVYLPTDWLAVGYEFRQKSNPYDQIPGLVGEENNWHVVAVGLILKDWTICVGWAHLGTLANSSGNGAWAIQAKYEF